MAQPGLTFDELRDRCLVTGFTAPEETLARVLRDEVRRGRIEYNGRRYVLNGGFDPETREALRQLELPDFDRSREAGRRRQ
ncbi:MAG TPA: hypothetical protein VFC61_01055 [Blastocatellia bacterium]|nr:hypothetical protein [Blastocatellia bacterium]